MLFPCEEIVDKVTVAHEVHGNQLCVIIEEIANTAV